MTYLLGTRHRGAYSVLAFVLRGCNAHRRLEVELLPAQVDHLGGAQPMRVAETPFGLTLRGEPDPTLRVLAGLVNVVGRCEFCLVSTFASTYGVFWLADISTVTIEPAVRPTQLDEILDGITRTKHSLRPAHRRYIDGHIRSPREGAPYFALRKVNSLNFEDREKPRHKVNFDNLTPLYPDKWL